MELDCASVFNGLSKAGRLKLRGAAATAAVTGFVRDDVQAHPIRYPLYAAYLLTVALVPIASATLIAGTILLAAKGWTPLARRLQGSLKEAFNHAALVERHKDFISEDPEQPGKYHVRTAALTWGVTKTVLNDTKEATVHAWQALKRLVVS